MTAYGFDPELAELARVSPPGDFTDLARARELSKQAWDAAPLPEAHGVTTEDVRIATTDGTGEIELRLYLPPARAGRGAVLDVHPGGFVRGGLSMNHADNLRLCAELGVPILAVDYRLAPEHPFPAPLEDCYAALVWLAARASELEFDPERIVLRGISAGGGLCAALCLLARERGEIEIAFQLLRVPELDDRLSTRSATQFVDTPLWDRRNAIFSWESYLGDIERGSADVPVLAAPARATDLSGLPPAYVSVAEFDPLRDEGLAYAQALVHAGVSVELHLFPGTFHGSYTFDSTVSRRERDEELTVLRARLA